MGMEGEMVTATAADIDRLIALIAEAHPQMVIAAKWDWVVRADAALKLLRSRTAPPATPPSATTSE